MHYVHTQPCVIDVATRDDTISSLFDNKTPQPLTGKDRDKSTYRCFAIYFTEIVYLTMYFTSYFI